jgi:arachidonate 15-lipoxygenase
VDVSLAAEARAGHLFAVDYARVTRALGRTRDSRWRDKYLAAPIAVFVEAPSFRHTHPGCSLVPLAIRIDQPQPNPPTPAERNPVYMPDDGIAWRIAKAHFEATDANWHVMVGHTARTHIALEAFCMATARQLEHSHPVRLLLEAHLRFTLPSARAAYGFYAKRRNWLRRPTLYFRLFSGSLQHTRELVKEDFRARPFHAFRLEADLAARGVANTPADYPFREDARRWLAPLARFTLRWVEACYGDDAAVRRDAQLAEWACELEDPARGAIRGLVPEGALDTRARLAELLAHVLFVAGPFHASA